MNFFSFADLFDNGWLGKPNKGRKGNAGAKNRRPRLALESLEDRMVPSTLPPATVNDTSTIGAGAAPVLVRDPTNPLNMVAVTSAGTVSTTSGSINGFYTTDGGHNWNTFGINTPNFIDPTLDPDVSRTGVQNVYTQTSDASVAFDTLQNFYVIYTEHNAANTSGVLLMSKFNFTTGTPVNTFSDQLLTRYSNIGSVLNPVIGIDTNLTSYTDPVTSAVQTDPLAANRTEPLTSTLVPRAIWVAWNTSTPAPGAVSLLASASNPNVIQLITSADGGTSFTNPVALNDGGAAGAAAVMPQFVFTQGTTPAAGQPTLTGGQMTVMWQSPGGGITLDRSTPGTNPARIFGASYEQQQTNNRLIPEAVDSGLDANNNALPDVSTPVTSTITLPANFSTTHPDFDIVRDLNATVAIYHPHLNQLRVTLTGPNPSGGAAITINLLNNRTNSRGIDTNNPFQGVADVENLGEGVFGTNLPGDPFRFTSPGTTFDQQATLSINDPAVGSAPPGFGTAADGTYYGIFQPEQGSFNLGGLNLFNGLTAAQLDGSVWTLTITDVLNDASDNNAQPPIQFLDEWSLRFSARLTGDEDPTNRTFGTDNGAGGAASPTTTVTTAETQGVGHAVIAVDNTLGSNSPYQGRIYIASTIGGDVFVKYSDDNGVTFSNNVKVNDAAQYDGFSGGSRPTFMPSIGVDPVTGTLVVTYYDTRWDAAVARVTTYIATSIDGGDTFSTGTFLNEKKTAVDAITGNTVVLEPIPSNQSGTDFGFHQAVSVYGGRVTPLWSGNSNTAGASLLTADVTIAAGPRVVYGDMGPVVDKFAYVDINDPNDPNDDDAPVIYNNTFAPDGIRQLSGFLVQFDRGIDPATFDASDIAVYYHDTTTPAGSTGTLVPVQSVTPLDLGGGGLDLIGPRMIAGLATSFLVTFATPQIGVGTYSYSIGPDVRDKIQTVDGNAALVPNNSGYRASIATPAFQDISATGNISTAVGDNAAQVLSAAQLGAFAFPFFGANQTSIAFSTNALITFPAGDTTATNTDLSTAPAQAAIAALWTDLINDGTGVNQIYWQLFTGATVGADRLVIQWNNVRRSGSSVRFSFQAVLFANGDIQFNYGTDLTSGAVRNATVGLKAAGTVNAQRLLLSFNQNPDLLVGPGQSVRIRASSAATRLGAFMDQNMNASPGEQLLTALMAPTDTVPTPITLGDAFTAPGTTGGRPLFALPYDPTTQPLIVPGPHVVDTFVSTGNPLADNPLTTDNVILNRTTSTFNVVFDRDMDPASLVGIYGAGTGPIARIMGPLGQINSDYRIDADPNPNYPRFINSAAYLDANGNLVRTSAADPTAATPRTYKVTLLKPNMVTPNVQSLSGTYTVVFNATARAAGTNDLVDTNLNAGLDQLRGVNLTGAPTTSKTYNSTGANNNVPIVTGATDQVETESQIVITDTYLIQGATLTLNIDYPFDPDLTVSLVAPDLTTLRLFTQVGTPPPASNAGTANFVNTVFDDTGSQPIQTALAPFNLGPYNPQEPLSGLIGRSSAGTWSLNVRNTRTGAALSGSKVIKSWSLTFKQPATTTGLGEPVADQYTASFRIFTMDPSNPLAHNTWTAVGPTSINNGKSTGRVGGLAVDPSDPSGNTVFVGGASGGVWKTTNFLTTDVDGPTYVPLTNFGPTFSLNIGSIAVFARNNDPKQSIVIAATGEGDTGSRGVGFIISRDGGSTWTLLDSTQNVYTAGDVLPAGKSIGDELPIGSALRDHKFVGTSAFKVVVDPNLTNDGEVVIYAALTSGVWVSYDTGKTWGTITAQGNGSTTADTRVAQLPTTGTDQATDVSLSAGSKGSNGNLQIVYAAIKGRGVFFSQNQGQSFTQTAPVGIPYQGSNAIDGVTLDPIPVTPPAQSPNGAKGRIVLVTPFATGNPVQDFFYQSWIYAAVVTGTGAPGGPGQLDGVYVSKDFGNNWTMLNLPITSTDLPTNDYTLTTKVDPISTPMRGSLANPIPPLHPKGNFAISLGIDPTNPNIIYLGGTNPALGAGDASLSPSTTGLIRIDATKVNDPKNLTIYDESNNDGGQFEGATSGSANGSPVYGVYQRQPNGSYTAPNTSTPYLNFTRDPENPFLASSTVKVAGIAVTGPSPGFSNDGSNATWTPFVGALGKPLTITRLRFDAMTGLATATVDSTASLINGLTVAAVIAGANPDAYNGNVTIRIVSATQFTYTPLTVPTSMTATTNTVLTVTPLTTGQHRMISYVDPLTGRGRLVFGGDQGVFTGVDDGTGGLVRLLGTNTVPTGTRNGNLQLAQFYGGATQPSLLAASIAGALFYGGSQDNGSPASAPDILQTGNLNWNPPTLGSGSDFGTDQTGSGTVYAYKWPCCNTSATAQLNQRDFFTVIRPGAVEVGAVGQNTASLIQSGDNPGTNQWPGQWPFINVFGGTGPFVNQFGASGRPIGLFTVNPIDGKSIVISSSAGRVFRTTDGGLNWFPIGNPADLDSSYAPALAFGAPSTSPGNAPGSLSNVVYAGTERGKIFATFTGGGYQGSTRWKDISAGLDGSPVQKIVTNPVRGTNELYAVTSTGVFYMADSRSDERPVGATAPTWVNITGDLLTLTHNPFNNPNLTETLLRSITSLAVDWRKQKVDSTGKARPDVYVGGTGGVFRMTTQDFGGAGTFRWQAFPSATAPSTDQSSGTARNGGLLPNVQITELELSLGNISSATGLPDQSGGPLLLVATTYGQGVFAIRVDNGLAPGPRVQSAVATNATANSTSINSVTVTFNGSVDPATFDRTDVVSLTTPDGTDITSTVTGVTDITPTPAAVTISSLTYNSGTGLVTATVGSTATLINGALVAIAGANQSAYNGNVIVRVVSGTQFTYTPVTPPAVPTATTNTSFTVTPFNQHNVYRIDFAVALQSLTYSTLTGRVTADTASTGALRTGALVTIAGATQAAYNGTFAITVLNGTQFTYTPLTAPPVTTATTATGFTASPAAPGAYKIVLGPNITDSGGNKMDQNRNGIDGEVPTPGKFGDDTFTGYLYANTGAVAPADGTGTKGPFVPTVYGTAANGVTFALVSNGSSFTTAGWSNFLALRTDLAPSLLNTLTGDFNGDGKADIAMRFKEGSGRQFQQWWVGVSNGSSLTFTLWGEWATGTWVDVLAGDFDGSGKDSITGRFLGSNPNADPALNGKDAVFVARSTGTSFVSTFWNAWVPRPWLDVRVGDFNGDGKADLVAGIIQNGLRNVFVAESSGSIFTQKYWQSWNAVITWADVRVGDFDGDGKSDLIGRVKENGKVYVSTDYAPSPVQTGGQKFWQQWNTAVNWLNVQVGDFDGDGKSDLLSVASLPGSAADGRMFVSRNFNKTLTYRPTLSPATAGTTFDGQQLWLARPGLATNWGNVISADFTGDGKSDVVMRYLGPAAPASGAQPALVTGRWYVARANPTGTGFILEDWKAAWGSVGGLTPQASWSNVRGGSHL